MKTTGETITLMRMTATERTTSAALTRRRRTSATPMHLIGTENYVMVSKRKWLSFLWFSSNLQCSSTWSWLFFCQSYTSFCSLAIIHRWVSLWRWAISRRFLLVGIQKQMVMVRLLRFWLCCLLVPQDLQARWFRLLCVFREWGILWLNISSTLFLIVKQNLSLLLQGHNYSLLSTAHKFLQITVYLDVTNLSYSNMFSWAIGILWTIRSSSWVWCSCSLHAAHSANEHEMKFFITAIYANTSKQYLHVSQEHMWICSPTCMFSHSIAMLIHIFCASHAISGTCF